MILDMTDDESLKRRSSNDGVTWCAWPCEGVEECGIALLLPACCCCCICLTLCCICNWCCWCCCCGAVCVCEGVGNAVAGNRFNICWSCCNDILGLAFNAANSSTGRTLLLAPPVLAA